MSKETDNQIDEIVYGVITPGKAKVSLYLAPEELTERWGEGILLILSMEDPKDLRTAEVFLSEENVLDLQRLLENHYHD